MKARFLNRLLFVFLTVLGLSCVREFPEDVPESTIKAPIFPDYGNHIEIPCNIAPLNFSLPDSVHRTYIKIKSSSAQQTLRFRRCVEFSTKFWNQLTAQARGGKTDTIHIEIAVKTHHGISRYANMEWIVRPEPVDAYLCYRLLPSIEGAYNAEKGGYITMELRERNMENFDERILMSNQQMNRNCFNCHVSPQKNAQKMMIHLRRPSEGSLYMDGERIERVVLPNAGEVLQNMPDSLRMPLTLVYPSWHPCGKWIAFSTNIVGIYGYAAHHAYADIFDTACNIILYNTENNEIMLDKTLWTNAYEETWPAWSADGKWLYFCRAAKLPADTAALYPDIAERIRHIRFDLCRVAFDAEKGCFSKQVQVVAASGKNLSYSIPRLNPDGKSLLVCRADFNSVPYHANGDLVWIDLENASKGQNAAEQENPAYILNSKECESYHDWSSNGRWVVFGSKRQNNHYEWLYIAYFDGKRFGKPFLLPQKQGDFYKNCFRVFNVPGFTRNASPLSPRKAVEGKDASTLPPPQVRFLGF